MPDSCPHCGGDGKFRDGGYCCRGALLDAERFWVYYKDPFGAWSPLAKGGRVEDLARAVGGVTYGPGLLAKLRAGGEFIYRRRQYQVRETLAGTPPAGAP